MGVNEPLTAAQCHVCSGPILIGEAVKEEGGLEHRRAAECVDFLRAQRDALSQSFDVAVRSLESVTTERDEARARVAGLEANFVPITNALRKAEALIESEFTRCGMGAEEMCAIKAEPALTAVRRALAALSSDPLKVGEAAVAIGKLCPPHESLASKLSEFPQEYGCPQCAVNHIVELEEMIVEMWPHLSGAGKLRLNDSGAGRIVERHNTEPFVELSDALSAAMKGEDG